MILQLERTASMSDCRRKQGSSPAQRTRTGRFCRRDAMLMTEAPTLGMCSWMI